MTYIARIISSQILLFQTHNLPKFDDNAGYIKIESGGVKLSSPD